LATPYTLKIHVVDGDPEGIRVIERMNWTGQGIAFRRSDWSSAKLRESLARPGVYILAGYGDDEDDLMTLYIGEGDGIRDRIESHTKNKDFWAWCIAFVSTHTGLNKAHVQWLEWALLQRAYKIARCKLNNTNVPREPMLSDADKSDMESFLQEVLQILPLVGLRSLEEPKVYYAGETASDPAEQATAFDTVVIPAMEEGFNKVFLGERRWHAVRLATASIPKIQYIAAYRSAPISAITHLAKVKSIEPYGDSGKYLLSFDAPAEEIPHVQYDGVKGNQLQGLRYTRRSKLLNAKTISDLLPWG
jgi:hypothetical protein